MAGFSLARDIFGNGAYAGFDYTDLDIGKVWGPDGLKLLLNANGSDPVAANAETVLAAIDKSKGAVTGAELLANGGFDSDTVWNKVAGTTISGGLGHFPGTNAGATLNQTLTGLAAGEFFLGQFDLLNLSAGSVRLDFPTVDIVTGEFSAEGTHRGIISYTAGTMGPRLRAGVTTTTLDVDNASVKKIAGNHARQITSNSRPSWNDNGGGANVPYLGFDGSDDALLGSLNPASEMTIALCFRPPADPTAKIVLGGGTNTGNLRCYFGFGDGTNQVIAGGWGAHTASTIKGTTAVGGNDCVALFRANASAVQLWLNGASTPEYSAAPSGSPSGSTSALALGAWNNAGSVTSHTACRIYRALAVQRYVPDNMILPLMRLLGQGVVSF